ncbi:DUF3592 domain-containing protein [Streptomyces sp. SCUT-3]|nr:DUF3592 domain-containing protein [Streptomyces sp. DJ]QMV22411.1 DUF3592 domain-containing protein [Streptomyces sp. SCUT-3]
MQVQGHGRGVFRWVAFGLIAVGTLFSIIGLIVAWASVSFLREAERAPGTVVALEWRDEDLGTSRRSRTNDRPSAYPVVEFTSADGTHRTFRSSTGSNPPAYEKGERVEVLYRADSPEDARIDGFLSLWLLPMVFGGVGLVLAGVGTGVALATRRRSR